MLKLRNQKFWKLILGAEKEILFCLWKTFGAEYAKSLDFHPNE